MNDEMVEVSLHNKEGINEILDLLAPLEASGNLTLQQATDLLSVAVTSLTFQGMEFQSIVELTGKMSSAVRKYIEEV